MNRRRAFWWASPVLLVAAAWWWSPAPSRETAATARIESPPSPDRPIARPDVARPRSLPASAPSLDEPADPLPAKLREDFAGEMARDPTVAMALNREKVERLELATARFDLGLAEGGFTADHIQPAVIDLFGGIELEPELDPEGRILGLEITSVEPGNPLLAAGFSEGDRIVEIDGAPLGDAADLPALFVALSSRFTLCADRGGQRLCRELVLE